jgi:hypothetical protein
MANVFHLQTTGLRASVYMDYVPSKANIADLPSRQQIEELLVELQGIPIHPSDTAHSLVVPDVGSWNAPLGSWLLRHSEVHTDAPLPS